MAGDQVLQARSRPQEAREEARAIHAAARLSISNLRGRLLSANNDVASPALRVAVVDGKEMILPDGRKSSSQRREERINGLSYLYKMEDTIRRLYLSIEETSNNKLRRIFKDPSANPVLKMKKTQLELSGLEKEENGIEKIKKRDAGNSLVAFLLNMKLSFRHVGAINNFLADFLPLGEKPVLRKDEPPSNNYYYLLTSPSAGITSKVVGNLHMRSNYLSENLNYKISLTNLQVRQPKKGMLGHVKRLFANSGLEFEPFAEALREHLPLDMSPEPSAFKFSIRSDQGEHVNPVIEMQLNFRDPKKPEQAAYSCTIVLRSKERRISDDQPHAAASTNAPNVKSLEVTFPDGKAFVDMEKFYSLAR